MKWNTITEENQIDAIIKESASKPVVIYKHSTSCPVSSDAKRRLENAEQPENIDFYYLDLLRYRAISNEIAARFHVTHKSPQVLLIQNGECVYNESHMKVQMKDIEAQVK